MSGCNIFLFREDEYFVVLDPYLLQTKALCVRNSDGKLGLQDFLQKMKPEHILERFLFTSFEISSCLLINN